MKGGFQEIYKTFERFYIGQFRGAKAQTTAVLLLLVILIFAGIGIFLVSMAKQVSQTEYMQLYANQMLLSMLRKDMGYTENECRSLADVISCVYFVHPQFRCGGTGPTCLELAKSQVENLVQKFEMVKGYRYLFIVKPVGFIPHSETGEITTFSVGNKTLENLRGVKIVATQKLERTVKSGQLILDVKLILAK